MATNSKPRTRSTKRKAPTAEQLKKREENAYARRIQSVFKNAGFAYLPTKDKERKFGLQIGELDAVFLFENIVLVCEDTIATTNVKDHLKKKNLLFSEIGKNKKELIEWLQSEFPEKFEEYDDYDISRYKVHFLYFTKEKLGLSRDEIDLHSPVKVVELATLSYFQKMAQNIKFSSRTDIFRYLGIEKEDIGTVASSSAQASIDTSVIYPSDSTGLTNGVRLVSFMLSAETLLNNSYVLRKDNWEDSIELYQRLIEKDRIQGIRRHLATKKTTFFNNIIVSLPRDVAFLDDKGAVVPLDDIQTYTGHRIQIPDRYNSIGVIDGQHRIFAHYQGTDIHEQAVAKLRKKFHLLVTGLVFPEGMSTLEQRKYESEIFLDINSNAKPVPADVLLFIETLKDPFSNFGIARQVLVKLNAAGVFRNLFQLSMMESAPIKIASIIKFALGYLVEISDSPDRPNLFREWVKDDPSRRKLLDHDNDDLRQEYIEFAAATLNIYFSAVRKIYLSAWKDQKGSKILSTTSINAFIMALRRSLPEYGILDFEGYATMFDGISIDFSRENFAYTSSQYNKFSKVLLADAFLLDETVSDKWIKRVQA